VQEVFIEHKVNRVKYIVGKVWAAPMIMRSLTGLPCHIITGGLNDKEPSGDIASFMHREFKKSNKFSGVKYYFSLPYSTSWFKTLVAPEDAGAWLRIVDEMRETRCACDNNLFHIYSSVYFAICKWRKYPVLRDPLRKQSYRGL
jgi:hypothetical protein